MLIKRSGMNNAKHLLMVSGNLVILMDLSRFGNPGYSMKFALIIYYSITGLLLQRNFPAMSLIYKANVSLDTGNEIRTIWESGP